MLTTPDNRDTAHTSRRARRTTLTSLLYQAEQRGRQHALEEVRMLAHGQLTPHVITVQHCIATAQAAQSSRERDEWLKQGFIQAQKLLQVAIELHSGTGNSIVCGDFEQTLREIALSLSAAYPACACRVEVSGHPSPLRDVVQRAFIIVLYNALHNAYRHAHPSSIHVHLQYAPGAAILVVADDGCGMAIEEQVSRRGRGLHDMQRVIAVLDGTLAIESTEGNGTRICATIPHVLQWTEQPERRF